MRKSRNAQGASVREIMSTLHKAWDQWELQQHTFGFLDFFLLRPDQYICRCSNTCTCQETACFSSTIFCPESHSALLNVVKRVELWRRIQELLWTNCVDAFISPFFQQWRSFCFTNALACIELQLGCSPVFSFFCTGCRSYTLQGGIDLLGNMDWVNNFQFHKSRHFSL
jgi:hypothetical protein